MHFNRMLKFKSLVLALICMSTLHAQKFTRSPFSAYGIGETGGLDHPTFTGMGSSSVAQIDSTILNFYNPSSYNSLAKGQPLFSTGISSRFASFEENNLSTSARYFGIDHLALAVPMFKRMGIAFGLKPFSRVGYDFYQAERVADDSIRYDYKGAGGTHEVFAGYSVALFQTQKHRLSVGFNAGYVFGRAENTRTSYIVSGNSLSGGAQVTSYRLAALRYDLGLNYQLQVAKNQHLTVAGTFTPEQGLRSFYNNGIYYASNVTNPNTYTDTILSVVDQQGTIYMPQTMSLGFNYRLRANTGENYNRNSIYEVHFSGEYRQSNWADFRMDLPSNSDSVSFANTRSYSFGVQFAPHYNFLEKSSAMNYIKRIRYRAGVRYADMPLVQNGQQLNDLSLTFGLGLPITTQRTLSSVNVSFIAGQRGNGLASSVQEKYLGVSVGVTIAPGFYEKWFRKFKID